MDPATSPLLDAGIAEFNEGRHWHAHEAWEHLWLELEGDEKRFVQGLIMAAAMLVQYGKGVRRGVVNHFANAQERLVPAGPQKWGIDVAGLLQQLEPYAHDAGAEGTFLKRDPSAVQIIRHSGA